MNSQEKLIERWKDKTKGLGFSPDYVAFWRYVDDLIDNQKRLPKEIKRLKEQLELLVKDDETYQETIIRQSKIITKAIEYIEENCVDDEFEVNLTDKEKEIKKVLDILKGSGKE